MNPRVANTLEKYEKVVILMLWVLHGAPGRRIEVMANPAPVVIAFLIGVCVGYVLKAWTQPKIRSRSSDTWVADHPGTAREVRRERTGTAAVRRDRSGDSWETSSRRSSRSRERRNRRDDPATEWYETRPRSRRGRQAWETDQAPSLFERFINLFRNNHRNRGDW